MSTVCVLSWGVLPVSVKGLVGTFDPYTLNFYRFVAATIPLGLYLLIRNRRTIYSRLTGKGIALLVVAVAALLINHLLFITALNHIPAGTSQVVMQIGPLLLLVCSVVIFKESFSPVQWAGAGLLVLGFAVFFNHSLADLFDLDNSYGRGVVTMASAAAIWVFYGLAQKLLLPLMSPLIIMVCCYTGGGMILYPLADKSAVLSMPGPQLVLLLICTFSSLIAYIAFAESMNHWEASKSSAFLAVVPLVAIGFESMFAGLFPTYIEHQSMSALSLAGAAVVVAGTMTITLGGKRKVAMD